MYKSCRVIDGKPRLVIVDENGKIVNRGPSKEDLKGLQEEPFSRGLQEEPAIGRRRSAYTDKELLKFLNIFYQENDRVPIWRDFVNNPGYPGWSTYQIRFGSWNNALKWAGLYDKKKIRGKKAYADVDLLNYLKEFYQERGKVPAERDFMNNPGYPGLSTYQIRFGSWNNALKLAGLDVDTLIKKGVVQSSDQKARLSELYVNDFFQGRSVDLAGKNHNSPCDGICPNGQTYDVKSSGLVNDSYFIFTFKNKEKEEIECYFLLGFNTDYTELLYVWRVPGDIIEKFEIRIRMNSGKFNVGNMLEYEITDDFKKVIEKWNKTR